MKPYDPNLREAMAEIRIICARRKIGGVVALGSKTHCEFANIIPEWCTIKMGEAAARIRILAKSDKEGADASVGHIYNMRDLLMRYAYKFMELTDAIEKVGKVDHAPIDDSRIEWHDPTKPRPN